jgi:hypothetical protein
VKAWLTCDLPLSSLSRFEMARRRSYRKDIKRFTWLQRYDSLICSSSKADLTSPKSILRSSKESMITALSAHLSQVERSGGDNGESEEEDE